MDYDRRTAIKSVGAVAAGLSVAGCFGEPADGPAGNDTDNRTVGRGAGLDDLDGQVEQTQRYLTLTEHSAFVSGEDVGVIGVVRNSGNRPLENVEVEVTLRDGDTIIGEFVDTAEEEIEVLRPGEAWRFKVVFEDENLGRATDYTISADADVAREVDR